VTNLASRCERKRVFTTTSGSGREKRGKTEGDRSDIHREPQEKKGEGEKKGTSQNHPEKDSMSRQEKEEEGAVGRVLED